MILGCGPGKEVAAKSNFLDRVFGRLKEIASRADGSLILPGDMLI